MQWRILVATKGDKPGGEDPSHIRYSLCHPQFAKKRDAYLKARYGIGVEVKRRKEVHLDFGGMIKVDSPVTTVTLSYDRSLTCWTHQISDVLYRLKKARCETHAGRAYYRMGTWPFGILYLSSADARKVIETLEKASDAQYEQGYKTELKAVLQSANDHVAEKFHGESPEEPFPT